MRLTKAVINLNNLKKNYLNIRKQVNNRKIMAVVKANAYGHDVKLVTGLLKSLGKQKPEYYAVAIIDEGVELRKIGVQQPILVFDTVEKSNASKYFTENLMPTVFNSSHLNILLAEMKILNIRSKIKVHVKIDTGMNRLGVNYSDAFDFIKMLSKNDNFELDGIYTHFATSDIKNSSFTKLQIKRFNSVIYKLKKEKINYGLAHSANSGAIINFPEAYYDMVRPGISLYGYYPSHQTLESFKLYPVMSIVSKVASVKTINKGDTVSYGRKFKAKEQTKIISVSIGYADGFLRALTNKAKCIIKGKTYNQVGTVAMDRIMFDVGYDNVSVGDKIIILGSDGKNKFDAWDWSDLVNTIPYEITCNINKRVPRTLK